jgi:hypothetical protein
MLHRTASPRAGAGGPEAISGRAQAGVPWEIFRQHPPVFLAVTGVIDGFGAPRGPCSLWERLWRR